MRWSHPTLVALCVAIPSTVLHGAPAAAVSAAQLDAEDILNRVDDLYRGKSSHAKMTMKVVTEHWSRELSVEMWSKGKDKSLARILSPKKERGMATLRVEQNIWNYLPKVKRVMKVPASMMGGSWMGSHFTNDDLVKESRMADDYTFSVTAREKKDGRELVQITCMPKADAAVVWGKVVLEVVEKTLLPERMLYYDEDLALARTMIFMNPTKFGRRTLPARMLIEPADEPDERTEIIYEAVQFNTNLSDSMFSLRQLER